MELEVKDRAPTFEITTNAGLEEMGINLKDMLPNLFGQKTRKRKMRVAEAIDYLVQEEEQKLIDMDQVTRVALERVERTASFSWTRSTRLPVAKAGTVRT